MVAAGTPIYIGERVFRIARENGIPVVHSDIGMHSDVDSEVDSDVERTVP